MNYNTKYDIGQRMNFSCFSNSSFTVKAQIIGIANYNLATTYADIFTGLFNNDIQDFRYVAAVNNTSYYYICKLLEGETNDYADENGIIVLCDAVILDDGTYVVDETFSLNYNISYNAYVSGYTSRDQLMTDIENFLESKSVTINSAKEELSQEEQDSINLTNLMVVANKLTELEDCMSIVDDLKSINSASIISTYQSMITLLQTQIDKLIAKNGA